MSNLNCRRCCATRYILIAISLFCVHSIYATTLHVYSYESGVLEDPAKPAPDEIFQMTLHPQHALETPCKLQINFEHGIIKYSAEIIKLLFFTKDVVIHL
jgi:argininosuccinate synthase